MKLQDALERMCPELDNAEDVPDLAVTSSMRGNIRINVSRFSLRLRLVSMLFAAQWPSYAPWSRQIHLVDNQLRPFSLQRIAILVARVVQSFYQVSWRTLTYPSPYKFARRFMIAQKSDWLSLCLDQSWLTSTARRTMAT